MEFPAPQPVGKHERSIAERHRMLVLLVSMFDLLPVGFAVGLFVSDPVTRLLITLGVAFALTYGLVYLLRRRFIDIALSQEMDIRPTLRSPGQRTMSAVHSLTNEGFSPVDTVVVVTETGITLTRPIVVMARHLDGRIAHASSIGAAVMTWLDDGTWLVTSTAPVVSHPTLRIQRVGKWDTRGAVVSHAAALRELAGSGVTPATQPPPLEVLIHLERLEQQTLAAFRANGVHVPSAKALTTSSAP